MSCSALTVPIDFDSSSTEWTAKHDLVSKTQSKKTRAHGNDSKENKSDDRRRDRADLGQDSALTIGGLRRLLLRMIATDSISIQDVPFSIATPFLSYTDFLACYVAQLSLLHASMMQASGCSKSIESDDVYL